MVEISGRFNRWTGRAAFRIGLTASVLALAVLALLGWAPSSLAAPYEVQGSGIIVQECPLWNQGGAGGEAAAGAPAAGFAARPGEVIVEFARGAQVGTMGYAATVAGATLKEAHIARSEGSFSFAVYSSATLSTEELLARFRDLPGVVAVAPNYVRSYTAVPDDPLYGEQWGLENTGQVAGSVDADIDAAAAWDFTTGSADVVVACIDSGVIYDHLDLAANMWQNPGETPDDSVDNDGNGYTDDVYGIDAYDADSDPADEWGWDAYGHGTHVAGIMAAAGDNGVGVAGTGWHTKIMALRNGGSAGISDSDSLACIAYVIDMKLTYGVNVVAINASWGGPDYSTVVRDAIQAAGDAGIVFCAAAGNNGTDNDASPQYPASYDCTNIIVVGATDPYDDPASFSNYGATSVDLFAPGAGILSTFPEDAWYYTGPGDLFYDDMESGAGNWTHTGTWAITEEAYLSPTHSWSDSPGGNYANSSTTTLTSRAIDLRPLTSLGPKLSFTMLVDLEYTYDWLYLDMSSNNGATWSQRMAFTGPGTISVNAVIPASYITSTFRFRFRLVTDSSVAYDGVYIDDIGIVRTGYVAWDGTSMATPFVTGAVGLLAAAAPGDTVGERIDRILSTVDRPASLSGFCATDGRLNVASALATTTPPAITSLNPDSGSTAGGTAVVISGSALCGATEVTFDGVPAQSHTVDGFGQITAVSPPHDPGTVQVQVTTPGGSTDNTDADDYTYVKSVAYSYPKGTDRYFTALLLSQAAFPDPLPDGSGVVVAPGTTFPEALCGAPLAAAYGGPVLLTPTTGLHNNVKAELQRLQPDYVFVIGLSTTIRNNVQTALPGATVTPIGGSTIYHMSHNIALALGARVNATGGDISTAVGLVTIGGKFVDALGLSPLACAQKWPIILTDSAAYGSAVHSQALATFTDLGITQMLKVGTYCAVPAGITGLGNLSGVAPSGQSHLARYYTSANVAEWAYANAGLSFSHSAITTGDKFPDALASGTFLVQDLGILLVSPLSGPVPQVIQDILSAHREEVEEFTFIACIEPVVGTVKGLLP